MNEEYISIGEAAKMLGVTPTTLRNWEKRGKLMPVRTPGRHRLFSTKKLRLFLGDSLSDTAFDWTATDNASALPSQDFYCQNSAIFQSKIMGLEQTLTEHPEFSQIYSLVLAVVGEIGNNSFDHNLGNWPDVPGIFFGYDLAKGEIVLADRGQGILKTLRRVRPTLKDDVEALGVAFTEIITGRAPEKRGNGLKFVRKTIPLTHMKIFFQSGNATISLSSQEKEFRVKKTKGKNIRGCFAFIKLPH